MNLSLGIIFGLLSMLAYGIANALSQIPTKKIGVVRTIFFRNVIMSILLFFLLLNFITAESISLMYIIIALIISFIGYIPLYTFHKAIQVGKVSIINPIVNSSIIFTIIFSIIFFNERLYGQQIIAIIIILIGVIFLSINFDEFNKNKKIHLGKGILYALITTFFWGLVYFLWKFPVSVIGPILTSFILEFGIVIAGFFHLKINKESLKLPEKKMIWIIAILAVLVGSGTLFYNLGINVIDVSVVASLRAAYPLISLLIGILLFKEKLTKIQWGAIGLTIIGVVYLSYVS